MLGPASSTVTAPAQAHPMGPLKPTKPRDETVTNKGVEKFIERKQKINIVGGTERDIRNIQRWLLENQFELRDLKKLVSNPHEVESYLSKMWISIGRLPGKSMSPDAQHELKQAWTDS